MPRARNIKPSFFTNEVLGTLDPIIGMTFIGLWCLADKDGILEDRPLRIKAELFPYREGLDVNGYLTVLARTGFVHRYVVDGIGYIQIINFEKHQHPHHTEKAKGFPKPQGIPSEQVLTPLNNGVTPSDSLIPDSLIPDSNTYVASKLPTCPHQEILSMFADVLPELPQPRTWEGTREKNLAARWKWVMDDLKKKGKEQTKEAGLDFFRRMFGYIKESDFLMGRNASWSADLGWIVKGENFSKIIDGNYENKVAA